MPVVDVPINEIPYSNLDDSENNKFSNVVINGYVNELKDTIKRPGLKLFATLGTREAIDGLFWWTEGNTLIAVSGGNVYKINESGVETELTGSTLRTGQRVSFANVYYPKERKNYLFMCNGGKINHTDGVSTTDTMASTGAPTSVSSLASINGYLLVNDDAEKEFGWNSLVDGTSDPFTWESENRIKPTIQGDDLASIFLNNTRLNAFGERTTEAYWNSGGNPPFARIEGAALDFGIGAKNSISLVNGQMVWLDSFRRVVMLSGNSPTVISQSIDKLLQGYSDVSNANGNAINVTGRDFYVLTLPTVRKTHVYDFQASAWYEWSSYDYETANNDMFLLSDYAYSPKYNKRLVGSVNGGDIYEMSPSYYNDAGEVINVIRRSGNIDHEIWERKKNVYYDIKIRRGFGVVNYNPSRDSDGNPRIDTDNEVIYGTTQTEEGMESSAQLSIRYRNDGNQTWSNRVLIPLRNYGNQEHFHRLWRQGIYQSRQIELQYSGNTPFVLSGMKEFVEKLRS